MEELEDELAQEVPTSVQNQLTKLPPLVIDGIMTPVQMMTQRQLRLFIPLMLKYSTGRKKLGWGIKNACPPWWPKKLRWIDIRAGDTRSKDEKRKVKSTKIFAIISLLPYYHSASILRTLNFF